MNDNRDRFRIGMLPVLVTVIWVGCVVVGGVGLLGPNGRSAPPPAPATEPAVTEARLIKVDLEDPPPVIPAAPTALSALPAVDTADPPDQVATPVVDAVEPSPLLAFAQPVEGPVQGVPTLSAAAPSPPRARQPVAARDGPPRPRRLIFGSGEGVQPKPEYPQEALQLHQRGSVEVQMQVSENGDVLSAAVTIPTWPLLDESALRTIRESWRFPMGPRRTFVVTITFN